MFLPILVLLGITAAPISGLFLQPWGFGPAECLAIGFVLVTGILAFAEYRAPRARAAGIRSRAKTTPDAAIVPAPVHRHDRRAA